MATRPNPEPLIRLIRSGRYLNKHLIAICASEGLNKNGVKAEFQQRIIERLQYYSARNETANFERLKRNIESPENIQSASASNAAQAANAFLNHTFNNHNSGNMGGAYRNYGALPQRLEFKPSPFYLFDQQIGEMKTCDVMQNHRHTVTISLKAIDHPALARVAREPDLKVLAFCAGDNQGRQDVSFPHQSEIKVNGGEVKANLRGLKNRPGSTRPVDITKELRLAPATYTNNVEMTYALTTKKFYFLVYVVKSIPVTELVTRLENGKRITVKTVLDEMATKARDADIVTTASVLSLKCPLSTLRIDLPVRSITCKHNQCFDATSYLQLQEQGPTWLCPICNNPAPFENLAVDEYVKDILKKTSRSADQVVVQPDGKWDVNAKKENNPKSQQSDFSDDSDDDLVEVTKTGESVRLSTPQVFKAPTIGVPGRPREVSTPSLPPSGPSSGSKRPHAIIDLTLSGDEDDEPIAPAPKRPNLNGFNTAFPAGPYRPSPSSNGLPPPR